MVLNCSPSVCRWHCGRGRLALVKRGLRATAFGGRGLTRVSAPAPVPPCVRQRGRAGSRISTHSFFKRGKDLYRPTNPPSRSARSGDARQRDPARDPNRRNNFHCAASDRRPGSSDRACAHGRDNHPSPSLPAVRPERVLYRDPAERLCIIVASSRDARRHIGRLAGKYS